MSDLPIILGILKRLHNAEDMEQEVSEVYMELLDGLDKFTQGKTLPITYEDARNGIFEGDIKPPKKTPWYRRWP